jgi:hypothetical protein
MKKPVFVVQFGLYLLLSTILARGSSEYQGPSLRNVPTFSKDVAPILFKNCTSCHRPGEIAPMSLLTYKDARPWARSIRQEVSLGQMPPWHADPAHGEFANDRRLSDADKEMIARWVDAGAPEGDPGDLPPQPTYADGDWHIGEPDVVLSMSEDYAVPAEGTLEYKFFEIPTNFTEDKWIQAMEARAGSRVVVHHIVVFAREPTPPPNTAEKTPGAIRVADGMDRPKNPEADVRKRAPLNDRPSPKSRGRFIGAFAPGQSARIYSPGTAIRLSAGTTLILQMHYTTNGSPTTDRSRIALIFAKEQPRRELNVEALMNQNFTIPAGAADFQVNAEMTIQRDITLWSMMPHTHLRGKRWQYEAIYPDGRVETILSVPKYDFNWQTEYVFKNPLKLPGGTRIRATAWYNNSASNRSNPDASADVHWGDQTWEEMHFTGFSYSLDSSAMPSIARDHR